MQDWNYLHTNDFELTLELGCTKYPEHSKLQQYWQENKEPLLKFLEAVHSGVKGFIVDKAGQPVANASVSVAGIDHEVVGTEAGEYWRLLAPGTYTLTVEAPGFNPLSRDVAVNNMEPEPALLNFTLSPDDSEVWSSARDFGLAKNLAADYLENDDLKAALADLENAYPTVVEALINEADWQIAVPGLRLALDPDNVLADPLPKVKVLLLGGLYGAQPLGRELLVRLARHLGEGYKQGDNVVTMILKSADIYILPAVDMAGFDINKIGQCAYKDITRCVLRSLD